MSARHGPGVVAVAACVAITAGACAPGPDVSPTQTAAPTTTIEAPRPRPTVPSQTTADPTTLPPVPPAPAPTPAPTAAPPATAQVASVTPGRYPLVTDTLPLVDVSRPTISNGQTVSTTRALTTLVWRPAVPGRWPLIVFAHGFQVGPTPYTALLEAWASAGYVVAAPEFPLTDSAVAGANTDENDIQNQPADVRFVLDALVAPSTPLSADIDPTRVVWAGHSDGAETALAASLAPAPAGEPEPRAVLAMSVSPLEGVTATANPPLMVTQGDADTINPAALGQKTYDEAAGPKFYMDLLGGGHLPPVEAGSQWLPSIEAATLTFFHLYLYGGSPADVLAAGTRPGLSTMRED
ncbi:hypothetical protein K6U06_17430 [Acidiferrimicrobium sp. IK]|uniref:alpha/beta hydrolase family protein n=1 Tax=Acidiferrimicrobium sp. IK TaxID=2871700 RepID=UPI0021CB6B85|nr:hypothetical protein [Acidiferrimicrobium sp. IK]MCU4186152.1 hypothetical protein [Acidiferrimicrobium sp. IK]